MVTVDFCLIITMILVFAFSMICLSVWKRMFLKKNLYQTKDIILKESYYRILPFRVWNHLFLCERYQHVPGICMYCTKLYIQNKKISDFINKDLRLSTVDFPPEITFYVEKIYLYSHIRMLILEKLIYLEQI